MAVNPDHTTVAQTQTKDRPISMAVLDQLNPSIARPSRLTELVVVWESEQSVATGADIYIQLVDAATGIPRWVKDASGLDVVKNRFDGIAVCTAINAQRNPRAAYDSLGGVIIVWEDYRNDPDELVADIYCQRFELSTGMRDPGWPADGIPVCQTGSHAERPRIACTGDGAYIAWIDHRNDPPYPPRNRDVYLQYIHSATASPAPNWQQNGMSVAVASDADQINPELDVDNEWIPGGQGVVVTYQDARDYAIGGPMWRVMVNHINAHGNQAYPNGDVPVTLNAPGNQEYPRVVTTGKLPYVLDRRAVIVWQDGRRQPVTGTQTDQRSDENIYAQKLGGECDLPTEMNWNEMFVKWNRGSDIRDHRFVVDSLGSMYAAWIENRPEDGGQDAVYVQKLDRDGVPKWYNGGVMVSGYQTFCEKPDICVDGDDGCYVTWNQNGTDVVLAHLDYLGATTSTTQDNPGGLGPRIVENDAGGVILAYNDSNTGIRLRHYDVALNLLDDALAIHPDATAYHGVKLSKDRVGGTWLVWHDGAEYFGTAYDGAGVVLGADKLNGAWGGIVPWSSITGEFDIDTDYIHVFDPDWHDRWPFDCVIAAVVNVQGGGNDVVTARLFRNGATGLAKIHGGQNLTWNPSVRLTLTGILHQSSQPAISADSTYKEEPSEQLGGGAIIAWASTYTHPVTQEPTTCVMTNRVKWSYGGDYSQGAFYSASTQWSVSDEVVLDDGLDALSTPDPLPDIATVFGAEQSYYPDGPRFGLVSWTSDRYSGCTGPYAVRVQQVDYSIDNTPPGSQPKLWNISGKDIAPLVGSVAQGAALLTTPCPGSVVSVPHAIPALWNDTRSGSFCLLATKVYDQSSIRCWSKQYDDFRPPIAAKPLSSVVAYPQPVSISRHGSITLTFPVAEEGTVRVSLFDAMGRRIIPEEHLSVRNGNNHITLELTRIPGLIPGVYMYSVEGAGVLLSRPVVFLR